MNLAHGLIAAIALAAAITLPFPWMLLVGVAVLMALFVVTDPETEPNTFRVSSGGSNMLHHNSIQPIAPTEYCGRHRR